MTRALTRRRFLSIAACTGLAGSSTRPAAPERLRWQGVALGADVSITLVGPDAITRPALARARLEIEAYEARFSLFRADSELVRLNAQGFLPDVDARWRALLRACDRLHTATGGAFDPSIQPLWLAHARGGDIDAARALVGWQRVRLPAPGQRGLHLGAGQALSFNGIAQGTATDAVREVLHAAGLRHVLIDIGETAAIGGPWQIGLSDPEAGEFAREMLQDNAVAVSTPAALRLDANALHILDPRKHAAPRWSSTAVTAQDATLADGLSTAACFMSLAELRNCLADMPSVEAVALLAHSGETSVLR